MSYLAHPLTLQLHPACTGLVYLRWLSPLGEWCGWPFSDSAAVDTKTEVTDADSIATADNRYAVAVRRVATDTLTVRAGDLTARQWDALRTLLDAPQVYQQLPDGTRVPVLVAANASTTRTSTDGKHVFEVDVRLPSRNALTH